jgi:hypothetical protein
MEAKSASTILEATIPRLPLTLVGAPTCAWWQRPRYAASSAPSMICAPPAAPMHELVDKPEVS